MVSSCLVEIFICGFAILPSCLLNYSSFVFLRSDEPLKCINFNESRLTSSVLRIMFFCNKIYIYNCSEMEKAEMVVGTVY